MTRFSNGVNLHLKSKKKGSRKKVEIEKKLSKKERRQLDRKEKLKVEPPLPNVVFKDNAPIVITIVGEDNARNMVYDKVFSKFIKSNFYDTTKFCANFNNSEKILTNNVTFTYKSRKITLLQVKDDLNCLVDYSKISDLTILAIEDEISFASYEYITLLSAHGLSKLCVYNIKGSASSLRKRIFKEISVKIPIFNNTTLVLNYISKMRVRPLTFRSNNAYILVDYINEGCFYGYLRGTPLTNEFMHLPGLGDFKIKEIERLNKEEKIKYEPEGVEEEESLEDSSLEELISEEESDLISQNNVKENQSNTEEGSQSNSESNLEESSKKEESKKGLTEKELEKKFEKKFVKKSFLEKEKENFKKQADSCKIDLIPGAYLKVKLELKNEYEKIKKTFEKNNFLLMGSIKLKDKKIITGNLKPHKWNKRLIKSGAPSLISIGWHRMLINPLLSTHDGKRERFLKHNLEFNNITFLSPIYKNTRFLLLKNDGFRIHGLGTIEEKVPEKIKKKCKLVGEVKKSYNNTAFIKNMFNSKQEVLKFLGGKLSSVSGLRGVIKRPIGDYGEFRSTFEGQLIERDVVFLKCYFTVEHDYKCILEEEKIQKELIDYEKMIKEKIEQKESSDENFVYKEPIRKKELFSREISKITKKLPFNKKEIIINEEKILSPEEQLFLKEKERIIELKRKIENKKCEEIFKKKEDKKNEIEEKKKGKVKSIIKSSVKSKRAKKGKKKKKKK